MKVSKDEKARTIATAMYNQKDILQHPLGAGAKKLYNRYMFQAMEDVDRQYQTALIIIDSKPTA